MVTGGRDFATCQPTLDIPCDPTQHMLGHLVTMPGGSRYRESDLRARILGERGHLMLDKTGCNLWHLRTPGDQHSSNGTRPITAWHSNSTERTRIIAMITLTLEKLALVKAGFSTKDSVHQGPGQLTQKKIAHPGGLAPPRKAVQSHAGLYSVTGLDRSC
jgi:hypothetical protein